ncbi:zinc ABC transporter substrate-binding protein AztC [Herbiconiux flava]|uniref:Zinc/manganese transport system substrate-binding protein n=1 Tax=Herbiconiux flava TaxID=881268 RepID=A0A852SIZ9_9MICO|nr:zinc ABC transporter substrate-binding protein AztC [Herbiconiux flava]NYD69824.1 zinc/manganese transport system substrate-binding protein [Herbiconiux flava]GLK16573.1 ABC transporter substrate-binding protein [Herbiconiux flava]
MTATRPARVAATAAILAALAALTGCTATTSMATDPPPAGRPVVAVTTTILGDVVTELVGDQAEVLTLMPPEADPHSFEISATEAARLRDAALVVSNGLGLEEGLQHHVDAAAEDGVPTVEAGELIDPLDYTDGDARGEPDPHFWTDPARMIDIVDGLEPTLAAAEGIDPARLAAAADRYRAELQALDAEMIGRFEAIPSAQRALVTNHHVFGYLADRYGFRVIGAVIPGGTTLAAPSASDLQELVDAIREAGVPTIFADASQPDRLVQVLAEEAGVDVDVVALHTESLSTPGGGAATYLEMMRSNAQLIATGLSP